MPKPHNRLIASIPTSDILIHRVSKDHPLKVENKLNAEKLIQRSRLPGLSHNKIPPSQIRDIFIKFINRKDYFENYWDVGSMPMKVKRSDYIYDHKETSHFFIKIDDLCYEDYYSNPSNASTKDYKFKVKPIHKPLNANYSHYELFIESDDGIIDRNRISKSGWAKVIGNSIRYRYGEKLFLI